MHPADIRAALQKKKVTQRSIADRLDVSEATVSQVIRGECASKRIARAISKTTGFPVSQLWPNRYPALELEELRQRAAA